MEVVSSRFSSSYFEGGGIYNRFFNTNLYLKTVVQLLISNIGTKYVYHFQDQLNLLAFNFCKNQNKPGGVLDDKIQALFFRFVSRRLGFNIPKEEFTRSAYFMQWLKRRDKADELAIFESEYPKILKEIKAMQKEGPEIEMPLPFVLALLFELIYDKICVVDKTLMPTIDIINEFFHKIEDLEKIRWTTSGKIFFQSSHKKDYMSLEKYVGTPFIFPFVISAIEKRLKDVWGDKVFDFLGRMPIFGWDNSAGIRAIEIINFEDLVSDPEYGFTPLVEDGLFRPFHGTRSLDKIREGISRKDPDIISFFKKDKANPYLCGEGLYLANRQLAAKYSAIFTGPMKVNNEKHGILRLTVNMKPKEKIGWGLNEINYRRFVELIHKIYIHAYLELCECIDVDLGVDHGNLTNYGATSIVRQVLKISGLAFKHFQGGCCFVSFLGTDRTMRSEGYLTIDRIYTPRQFAKEGESRKRDQKVYNQLGQGQFKFEVRH